MTNPGGYARIYHSSSVICRLVISKGPSSHRNDSAAARFPSVPSPRVNLIQVKIVQTDSLAARVFPRRTWKENMVRLARTLFIIPLVACGFPARAGEQPDRPARPSPRVGLVLSGGGARGAAHIGVLKVVEREQIPIDCIAGTSFGALVGGFYALGYSAAEIEKIFAAQDWDDLFSDSPDRRLAPIARRRDFRYLAQLDFRRLTPELPSGMWGGQ